MTGRDYCRIDDDPSYDYSDYDEGKGYYKPYEEDDYDDDEVEQDD
jgi:hypothetical protein